MNAWRFIGIFLLGVLGCGTAWTQTDSTEQRQPPIRIENDTLTFSDFSDSLHVARDTQRVKKGFLKILAPGPRPPYDPAIAWKRSAIFPGWGQIYNKAYWKLPLVYGAYVGVGLVYNYNRTNYRMFRQAFIERSDEDPNNDFNTIESEVVTLDGIRRGREFFRKNRDLSIIAILGVHALQMVEAYVDAHLKGFDISDDLTLHTGPSLTQPNLGGSPGVNAFQPGIHLTLQIK